MMSVASFKEGESFNSLKAIITRSGDFLFPLSIDIELNISKRNSTL